MSLKATIGAAVLFIVGGCAPTGPNGPQDIRPGRLPPLTLDCIFMDTIDNWAVIDPYHVIVYAPEPSTAYLVELSSYCQPLAMYPDRIGIDSHEDGLLCARDQDALRVGGQRCPIAAIVPYKVDQTPRAAK